MPGTASHFLIPISLSKTCYIYLKKCMLKTVNPQTAEQEETMKSEITPPPPQKKMLHRITLFQRLI